MEGLSSRAKQIFRAFSIKKNISDFRAQKSG